MSEDQVKPASGVLQFLPQGGGFLRDPSVSFYPGREDVWISRQMIQKYGLSEGALVKGEGEKNERGWALTSIDSVCGLSPEDFQSRTRFEKLVPINPNDRIHLGNDGDLSMRIVDLITPIGKGTRAMIVAPPKSGKTTLLEKMAHAISQTEKKARLIVLLVDERPEEVTHFKRNVNAEVLASSSDQSVGAHVQLTEMIMAQIRCELECGQEIIVLMDSLTRMARSFNQSVPGTRRTLSGGIDASALEIPRRFFGLARNIENGGSVTVIATAMVQTGSRMDDYIFEEFKGTGNSELVLDRSLSDTRIFPAINILASGTRKEELLLSEKEYQWVQETRRKMADSTPRDAMQELISSIKKSPSNEALIA